MKRSSPRTPCSLLRIAALLSFLMVSGCNLGGYPDLGEKLDTLTSIGEAKATAWMRTRADGSSEILVLGESENGDVGRFAWITMEVTSTGSILAGSYAVAENRITLLVRSEYTKILELEVPPASRNGSSRNDYDPPQSIVYDAELVDDRLHLQQDGDAEWVMTDLWDVIPAIDVTTQTGIDMLARVFNLSTVALQMRIPGFGGAGLLQYAGSPSDFVGVVAGMGSIELTEVLNPVAEIFFDQYKDYPGIVLHGDQISKTSMAGDGHLEGTIHFSMADPRKGGVFRVEGDLTYHLSLKNGTSSAGGYTIVLSDGATWDVSYREAENMDFRTLLPPR